MAACLKIEIAAYAGVEPWPLDTYSPLPGNTQIYLTSFSILCFSA